MIALAAFLGALGWSLAEYLLHRFVGHRPKSRLAFSREHLAHHAHSLYFTPLPAKLTLAVPTGAVLITVGALTHSAHGVAFALGFLSAYAAYEVLHRRLHTHAPRNAYGRWARRHHFHHHFGGPKTNHGVTSPIWDLVFGTYQRPEQITVPPRQPVPWLLDDQGHVLPTFAHDYRAARA